MYADIKLLAMTAAFLARVTAKNSTSFILKSVVLHPHNLAFNDLYFSSFSIHPGDFYVGVLAPKSPDFPPPLRGFLTGTEEQFEHHNASLESFDVEGQDGYSAFFGIKRGVPGYVPTPNYYVSLDPGFPSTFGLHFDDGVLEYKDVKGHFYACDPTETLPEEEFTPPPGVYELFYKSLDKGTPVNCSTVNLVREKV